MHLGNYDECLSVVKAETANETAIYGQYCSIFIQPHDPRVIDILINNMHGTPVSKIVYLHNFKNGAWKTSRFSFIAIGYVVVTLSAPKTPYHLLIYLKSNTLYFI